MDKESWFFCDRMENEMCMVHIKPMFAVNVQDGDQQEQDHMRSEILRDNCSDSEYDSDSDADRNSAHSGSNKNNDRHSDSGKLCRPSSQQKDVLNTPRRNRIGFFQKL